MAVAPADNAGDAASRGPHDPDGGGIGPPPRPRARMADATLPALRWYHFLLFAVVYLYAFPYFDRLRNANEMPRILMTKAIVNHRELYLDHVQGELFTHTDTAVAPNHHTYPNKPPGPSVLAVPVYAVCKLLRLTSLRQITWAFRVFVVTVPSLLFLPLFYRLSRRFTTDEISRRIALVAYALGSQAMAYALLFMSHALTAVLAGSAFVAAVAVARRGTSRPGWAATYTGFACSLAVAMDYQSALPSVVIGLYVLLAARRRVANVLLMAAGALPIAVLLGAYHQHAYGGVLKSGYSYAVDTALKNGFMGLVGPSWTSLVNTLFLPANGLVVLAPWVLLAIVGAIAVLASRGLRRRCGAEVLACAVIFVADTLMLGSLVPYMARGGWCVGPRYMTLAMPFVAWLAAAGFEVAKRRRPTRLLGLALVLASVVVFVVGATTFPHWPDRLANPLYDLIFPLLGRGYVAHSLGTAIGLRGLPAMLPLYAFTLVAVLWLFGLLRRRALPALVVVCSLAATLVVGQRAFPMTDQRVVSPWPMIETIWEPRPRR
jgi:MFS family permease